MRSFDVNNIFSLTTGSGNFTAQCRELFRFQFEHNAVYRQWCGLIGKDLADDKTLTQIPALPISFFKTHEVVTGSFRPELLFESSGTTGMVTSRHRVKHTSLYQKSFREAFRRFYGEVKDWCVLGLLPAYLERQHSSLVYMVDDLVKASGHPQSGFYLNEFEQLSHTLQQLEAAGQNTLLIGVTFGLLDFAEAFPQKLRHTTVMETGGMKGRKKEMTRAEVHHLLCSGLGVDRIHSEYGMTELLSQAYSKGGGRFTCPPWMRVLVRDEEDPLRVSETGRGLLQVIDLANVHSCAYIATEDVGIVHADGSFEVWGRLDNSDIRGCSLLVV
ncbi:LuxE/PaaK family acyltransferase [Sediminibacterium soli]|uniref:LuxE/PaaK family acyltransferase n=1 Tax=Sediminibacterium soli TaxID=2698829 RepID=UPI00137A5942|nr:acyl transferase [Sediminibacterium soli]NCI46091.1 acyl transferase [Sediminibacterium soli]